MTEPLDAVPTGGRRLGDLSPAQRRAAVALAASVAAPFVIAALQAGADGWIPVGDDGAMATAARQVLSAHPPLTGEVTSAGKYGISAYHPGPLAYYVLAPFVALLGAPWGMLMGAATVSATSMVLIGYTALRTAGTAAAMWAWGSALLVVLSLGGTGYLYRPFKTVAAVLPILLFLHLCAALAAGRTRLLPLWVLAGSYPVAASVQYLLPLAGPTLATMVLVLVRRTAGGSGLLPRARRVLPDSRAGWRALGLAILVGLVAWWAPLYEAAANEGGNLRQLYRGARAASSSAVGITPTIRNFVRAVAFDPAMTATEQSARVAAHLALVAVVMVVTVVLAVRGWRRLGRPHRSYLWIGVAAAASVVLAQASAPGDEGFGFYRILAFSPVGGFLSFTIGLVAVRASGWAPRSPGRRTGAGWDSAAAGAVAALAVLAVLVTVPGPLDPAKDNLPWTFAAVDTLTSQSAPHLAADGRWHLSPIGPRSALITMSGLAANLEGRGVDTNLTRPPGLGGRFGREPRRKAGDVLVSPADLPAPGQGWSRIASYVPPDRDGTEAEAVAEELRGFALRTQPRPLAQALQAIPSLLCPGRAPGPVACPEGARVVASSNPIAELPPPVVAMLYVEHFDDDYPFPLLVGPAPPADLLRRARQLWLDIPYTVHLRPA